MREINNNNPNSLNFSGVQKLDQQKDAPLQSVEVNEQPAQLEMQDLSQMPTAVTGRSLVFKGDSIEKDVNFLLKNPEFCKKANKFFDAAEAKHGYENAAKLMDTFVNEFQK